MTADTRDVIVIGAGIVGCLTGYLLAKQGLKVTILEADSVGSHASGFAFGGLGPLDGSGIPDPCWNLASGVFNGTLQSRKRFSRRLGSIPSSTCATDSTWRSRKKKFGVIRKT